MGHEVERSCQGRTLLGPQSLPMGVCLVVILKGDHGLGLVVVEVEVETGHAGEGAQVAEAGEVVGGDAVLVLVAVALVLQAEAAEVGQLADGGQEASLDCGYGRAKGGRTAVVQFCRATSYKTGVVQLYGTRQTWFHCKCPPVLNTIYLHFCSAWPNMP